MNGLHDIGGMHGFGPILRDEHEALFPEHWECRAFALLIAVIASGALSMDEARDGVERMDPLLYLRTIHAGESYYWRWLCATEILLERKGIVTAAERHNSRPGAGTVPAGLALSCLKAEDVPERVARRGSARLGMGAPAQFSVGDRVQARNLHPEGHTRLPRYVRGRTGRIERDHGVFSFPDTSAAGLGPKPQHLYLVRFEAAELWGGEPGPGAVLVDLWDDYLEPSDERDT